MDDKSFSDLREINNHLKCAKKKKSRPLPKELIN